MTSSYFRNADGIILMFDLSRPETFENLKSQWYKDCLNYTSHACIIIVGSKSDLTQRVPQEDIDDFADSIGVKYLTSAHNSPRGQKLRSSRNGPIMRRFRSFVKMVIPNSPQRSPTTSPTP